MKVVYKPSRSLASSPSSKRGGFFADCPSPCRPTPDADIHPEVFWDFSIYIWPSRIAYVWGCCSGKAKQRRQEDPEQHPL